MMDVMTWPWRKWAVVRQVWGTACAKALGGGDTLRDQTTPEARAVPGRPQVSLQPPSQVVQFVSLRRVHSVKLKPGSDLFPAPIKWSGRSPCVASTVRLQAAEESCDAS